MPKGRADGTQITARDNQFWQNLVTANKHSWAGYSPGEYPDNVLSTTISPTNPLQITLNLSQASGSYFFTYNELSQITPLPQHVWDKESATGAVGDYDMTPAGAEKVFAFLDAQSKSISTYDTNPLWQVVSGPWKLKLMDTAGNVSMIPNTAYGGPAATSPTNTTVQPERGRRSSEGQWVEGQPGRDEHLHQSWHRHRAVRRGRALGREGILQRAVRERSAVTR